MRVRRLTIRNFRGVSVGTVDFPQHTLVVGGSNVGEATVCEALELVLGPERLGRRPVIEEHDFHVGRYLEADGKPVEITITAVPRPTLPCSGLSSACGVAATGLARGDRVSGHYAVNRPIGLDRKFLPGTGAAQPGRRCGETISHDADGCASRCSTR
jgi:putative ATP-dependent endonuclease of OLD family